MEWSSVFVSHSKNPYQPATCAAGWYGYTTIQVLICIFITDDGSRAGSFYIEFAYNTAGVSDTV